ncbi:hypothetical protein [Oleiagrimonas sp.]|jgi:hypothetical protein|uniref:hypothetical protein n=1 Tax=Oleiagrimonas sp. TaxID=2010330 RepID=UPI0026052B83|nr:hypothetical protein [Oleiagrimonas sp.]MDA3913958.1 hypothetical protein [Oleiagrimonas sp.]
MHDTQIPTVLPSGSAFTQTATPARLLLLLALMALLLAGLAAALRGGGTTHRLHPIVGWDECSEPNAPAKRPDIYVPKPWVFAGVRIVHSSLRPTTGALFQPMARRMASISAL